jgi:hypothetical protein
MKKRHFRYLFLVYENNDSDWIYNKLKSQAVLKKNHILFLFDDEIDPFQVLSLCILGQCNFFNRIRKTINIFF